MKIKFSVLCLFALFLTTTMISCDNAANELGVEIQPSTDKIDINATTFALQTETFATKSIVSKPDSFLLGTYIDEHFGATRADILTQVALPKAGYTFIDPSIATTRPDSIYINIAVNSSFGVSSSPMKIDVYELKKELDINQNYLSDIEAKEYADLSKPIGTTITTVINPTTGNPNKIIRIKLSANFLDRFFTTDASKYASQEAFLKHFKGLYITTSFGSSTMLNISRAVITMYFHYTYKSTGETVNTYLNFPTNSEIKSISRIGHPTQLLTPKPSDKFNHIVSPANYYTKVKIPIQQIQDEIVKKGKILDVNGAILNIDVLDSKELQRTSYVPYVSNMLLIRERDMERFFLQNELPTDTTAFLSELKRINLTPTTFKYMYSFDNLANLIQSEVSKKELSKDGFLHFVLVPVSVKKRTVSSSGYNTTSIVSAINQQTQIEASTIYGGTHTEKPMKLEVVYSNF